MSPEFYMELAASTNSLQHHGVEGQKWGKRNGPPYPLDYAGREKLQEQRGNLRNLKAIRESKVAPNVGRAVGTGIATLAIAGFEAVAGMPSSALYTTVVGLTASTMYLGRAGFNKAMAKSASKKIQKINDSLNKDREALIQKSGFPENAINAATYKSDDLDIGDTITIMEESVKKSGYSKGEVVNMLNKHNNDINYDVNSAIQDLNRQNQKGSNK